VATSLHSAEPLLLGLKNFQQTVREAAKEKVISDASVKQQWREVSDGFARIYKDPHAAAIAMKIDAIVESPEVHRAVLDQLARAALDQFAINPESFGELRGRSGLSASKAEKQERQSATEGGVMLKAEIERYIRLRSQALTKIEVEETAERRRAAIDIPTLSQSAIV
jgi:hypothetical protein